MNPNLERGRGSRRSRSRDNHYHRVPSYDRRREWNDYPSEHHDDAYGAGSRYQDDWHNTNPDYRDSREREPYSRGTFHGRDTRGGRIPSFPRPSNKDHTPSPRERGMIDSPASPHITVPLKRTSIPDIGRRDIDRSGGGGGGDRDRGGGDRDRGDVEHPSKRRPSSVSVMSDHPQHSPTYLNPGPTSPESVNSSYFPPNATHIQPYAPNTESHLNSVLTRPDSQNMLAEIIQLASYNHWKLKQTETELAAARTESEKNKAHFAQFPIIEERYKSTERTKEAAYKEALRESELSTAALNTFLIELAGNRVEVNKQRERDIVRIQHDILQTAKVEWQSEVRKTVDDELGSKGIESVLKELKEQVKSLKVTEAAHQDLKEEFLRYKKDNDAKLKNLYTTHDTRVDAVRKRMEGLENKVETSNNAEKKYEAVQLDIEKLRREMIQVKTEVDQKVLNLSATQSTPAVAAPPADYAHVQSLVQTQIDELRDQIFKNFQNFDQALQSNQEIIAGELGRLEEEMNTKITASVSNIPTPIDHMPAINELESKFESNLSELTSKMSGLETKLNTVDLKSNSHHDQSNANKAEFKEKITQVEYRINEAKQSMNAIQPMFTNMQKELGELSQFFREMKARVDYLQNNYEAINTAIKGISTQMSNFTLGEISDRVWKYLSGGHPILTDAAKSIQQLKALMARLPEHLAQAPPTPGGRGGVPTHSMPMNNSHALNNNSGVNGVANHLPNPVVEQQIAELRNQISQFGQDIATFRLGMETSLRATEGQLKEHQLEYLPGRLSENEEVLRGFIVENTSGRLNKHIQEYDQHLQEYREKMDEISAWSVHILSRLMEMHKQITMVLSKLELPPMPKTGSEEPSSSNRGDMRIGGAADTNSAPPASSNQPQAIQQSHSLVQHASNIQGSGSTMDGDRWRAVGRDEIN